MAFQRPSYSTVQLIRLAYPMPRPIDTNFDSTATGRSRPYCVGGAVYLFARGLTPVGAADDERFPPVSRIAAALRTLNPKLAQSAAVRYALSITQTNDMVPLGGPEAAWHYVEEALRPSGQHVPSGRRRMWRQRGGSAVKPDAADAVGRLAGIISRAL